jgi:16S rRNA (guanine(1405)-N(7))-methyltransferase
VTDEVERVVERVATSRRYRHVDPSLLRRLAGEELARPGTGEDAVKRVKRRLHQAVGAFARGSARIDALRDAWHGDLADPSFRAACAVAMRAHVSTAERVPHLATFYRSVWELIGTPVTLLDLGCGLGPLALPWMGLAAGAHLVAVDVDGGALATVDAFLDLVGQPHRTVERDLCSGVPHEPADVALLLKLVTTLDRQDPEAAARLVGALETRYAVASFTRRSLGGRSRGMERTYRARLDRLARDVDAREVREASVANELVFIFELARG